MLLFYFPWRLAMPLFISVFGHQKYALRFLRQFSNRLAESRLSTVKLVHNGFCVYMYL